MKYLLSILYGKWIVSFDCVPSCSLHSLFSHVFLSENVGIEESAAAGKWLPEEQFEVVADNMKGRDGPRRGRLSREAGKVRGSSSNRHMDIRIFPKKAKSIQIGTSRVNSDSTRRIYST
jgi:hypothetical protein